MKVGKTRGALSQLQDWLPRRFVRWPRTLDHAELWRLSTTMTQRPSHVIHSAMGDVEETGTTLTPRPSVYSSVAVRSVSQQLLTQGNQGVDVGHFSFSGDYESTVDCKFIVICMISSKWLLIHILQCSEGCKLNFFYCREQHFNYKV